MTKKKLRQTLPLILAIVGASATSNAAQQTLSWGHVETDTNGDFSNVVNYPAYQKTGFEKWNLIGNWSTASNCDSEKHCSKTLNNLDDTLFYSWKLKSMDDQNKHSTFSNTVLSHLFSQIGYIPDSENIATTLPMIPEMPEYTTTDSISVEGFAYDENTTITINGQEIPTNSADYNSFPVNLDLEYGKNPVKICGSNSTGKSCYQLIITRDTESPNINSIKSSENVLSISYFNLSPITDFSLDLNGINIFNKSNLPTSGNELISLNTSDNIYSYTVTLSDNVNFQTRTTKRTQWPIIGDLIKKRAANWVPTSQYSQIENINNYISGNSGFTLAVNNLPAGEYATFTMELPANTIPNDENLRLYSDIENIDLPSGTTVHIGFNTTGTTNNPNGCMLHQVQSKKLVNTPQIENFQERFNPLYENDCGNSLESIIISIQNNSNAPVTGKTQINYLGAYTEVRY